MNMWWLLSFGKTQKIDVRTIRRHGKNISNAPVRICFDIDALSLSDSGDSCSSSISSSGDEGEE